MANALEVLTRGVDSSGRAVRGTRQNFQFYDRLNEGPAKGLLVIVQGSWSNAEASGTTHLQAMCMDYRTWNLTEAIREDTVRQGRDWMGTMYYRTEADGFDPHLHNNLIGDAPADPAALRQVDSYRLKRNGLANNLLDRNQYRPATIHDYRFLEEDMGLTPQEHQWLQTIHANTKGEKTRDANERERDKQRFERLVTLQGNAADDLGLLITRAKDQATKNDLKRVQEKLLLGLKEDPDVTEKDNPSDEGLAERNFG